MKGSSFDSDGKPLDLVDAQFAPPGSRPIPARWVGLKINADRMENPQPYAIAGGPCPRS